MSVINVTTETYPDDRKPQGFLSDETVRTVETALEVGILPALVLAGVTMNILNMAVFLRQGLSDRINLCLFSLALSDTGYITCLLSTRLYSMFSLFDISLGKFWRVWSIYLIGPYTGFVSTSSCLTLIISLERCLLVISPLKARTMLPTRYMAGVLVLTFCACLSFCCIFGFKYDIETVFLPNTNTTIYRPVFSKRFQKHVKPIDYVYETFNFVVPIVTFICVSVATAIIVVRMRNVAEWRQKSGNVTTSLSASERRDTSLIRMLVVVCIMYIICNIPYVLRIFIKFFVYEFQFGFRYENSMYVSATIMHLTASFNSSLNFVVYYIMSTRFRETLKEMLCHRLCSKEATPNKSDGRVVE